MIGKTLSFTWAKFALSFQINKQMKQYFLAKSNFFQLRKIFTSEYTKYSYLNTRKALLWFYFPSSNRQTTQTNFKHKERKYRVDISLKIRGFVFKNKGARLHPFPLFPTLSSCIMQTANTTYIPIFVIFICVTFITYTNTARFTFIPCLASFLRLKSLCGFFIAFWAFLVSFSFLLNRPTPTPISRYRIGGYPIP